MSYDKCSSICFLNLIFKLKIILTQAVVLLVCTIAMDSNLKLKKITN